MRTLCWLPLLIALVGCSKVSEANYAKLKVGMTYDEVTQVLGRADRCDEAVGIKHCVWGDETSNITADFVAGNALIFSSKNIR